ncbi:methyltransferase [Glycomyces sp. A-F 0318]|uniref:methyltransferase n=1 Tax=Glycomyces amatae TaxID=2881355 RepID=UPI001E47E808|nr:methyltransferase [Glycomyces amatae]MCD0445099.1 methyltransferase [Glycomyces amatae]
MAPVRHTHRPARPRMVEATFLPGLGRFLADELRERLPGVRPRPVPDRDDALRFPYAGPLSRLRSLRTAVAVFTVLGFGVARPASLLHGDHLRRIAAAVRDGADGADPARSFRIEAAGRDSMAFRHLAVELARVTGLAFDPHGGDLVLRFRRSPAAATGWDVLVRASTRPLSARRWRVADYPGAANATIAAAMARALPLRSGDRVLNLMCGSGTLLVERLLAGPARAAVGVDADESALAACRANLDAAGVRADLVHADAAAPDLLPRRRFEVILADPPWGTRHGDHAANEALYGAMLRTARRLAAPGARFAVLTHEVRLMERLLPRHERHWHAEEVHRAFQKGHHPRIYVLGAVPPSDDHAGERR